jgi:hypothetical protein
VWCFISYFPVPIVFFSMLFALNLCRNDAIFLKLFPAFLFLIGRSLFKVVLSAYQLVFIMLILFVLLLTGKWKIKGR